MVKTQQEGKDNQELPEEHREVHRGATIGGGVLIRGRPRRLTRQSDSTSQRAIPDADSAIYGTLVRANSPASARNRAGCCPLIEK